MSNIEFVSVKQAFAELTVSPATGWRWIKLGLLPKPVKLGPNRVAFVRSEFEAYKKRLLETRGDKDE